MNKSNFTNVPYVPVVIKSTVDWSFEIMGYLYVTSSIQEFLDLNMDIYSMPDTLYLSHTRTFTVSGSNPLFVPMLAWDADDSSVVSIAGGQIFYITRPDKQLELAYTTVVPFS